MPVAKQTSNYKPAPAGTHIARCYGCISLGTQTSAHFAPSFKILYQFELSNEMVERDGKKKPMVINKEYTLSLSPKSNLRKVIESWRGKLTDQELKGFDVSVMVGQPCMISIIHEPRKDGGGMRDVITAITALPKGYLAPPQINPSVKYEIEQGKDATFAALPQWLQAKVLSCAEWNQEPVDETAQDDGGPSVGAIAPESDVWNP